MKHHFLILCVGLFFSNMTPSWAENDLVPLSEVLGDVKVVKAYKSKNKHKDGLTRFPKEELVFPLIVFEEEANGMAMVEIKGEKYWVDSSAFNRNIDVPKPA